MREKVTLDFNKEELAVLVQTHPVVVAELGAPEKGYTITVVVNAQKVVITSEKETVLPGMEATPTKDEAEDDLPSLDDEMIEDEGTSEEEPAPLTEDELDIGSNANVEPAADDDDFFNTPDLGLEAPEEAEEDTPPPAFTEY